MKMDIFKNFIFKNNEIINEIIFGYDVGFNCNKEKLNTLFLETDVIEEISENCNSLFELDCCFMNMGQGHYQDCISITLLIGYYNSVYFSLDYFPDEENSPELKFLLFDKLPLNHCYESCKEMFKWAEILLDGYEEHKDYTDFRNNYSFDIDWSFNFLEYLSFHGFDIKYFQKIQRKVDLI